MPDTILKLQFRSKASDENLTLQEFAEQSRDFNAALSGLDQFISSQGKTTVAFRVIDLKHSSPSEMTLDAVGLEDSLEDNSARVIHMFITTIENLNAGKGFETLPRQVLEPLYRIARSLAYTIKEIKVAGAATTVIVTDRIFKLLEDVLETDKIIIGTIRGTLEQINLHRGANNFRLYPIISGPNYVTCNFPPEIKERAKQAIDHYVVVSGRLHFHIGAEHPHLIEVDDIEILPQESELPTLASFHGIITPQPGKSAEDMLEQERHGQWD